MGQTIGGLTYDSWSRPSRRSICRNIRYILLFHQNNSIQLGTTGLRTSKKQWSRCKWMWRQKQFLVFQVFFWVWRILPAAHANRLSTFGRLIDEGWMVIFQSIVQFIYLLPLTSLLTIHLTQEYYSTPDPVQRFTVGEWMPSRSRARPTLWSIMSSTVCGRV